MKNRIRRAFLLVGLSLIGVGSASAANLVVNGDFNGFTGNTNYFNTTPPDWTTWILSPDTFNSGTNFGGYAWSGSQTGGDFLHAISGEATYQILTGLVVGTTYEFSFEQSISSSGWGNGDGFWSIGLDNVYQYSAVMVAPTYGTTAAWQWQSMTFVATSTTAQLTLAAARIIPRNPYYPRSEMAIDGLYFGTPGGRAASVPDETSSSLLVVSALAGLIASRKRLV